MKTGRIIYKYNIHLWIYNLFTADIFIMEYYNNEVEGEKWMKLVLYGRGTKKGSEYVWRGLL